MYIFKNALRNVASNKTRNILAGVIVTGLIIMTTIAMLINQTTLTMKQLYKEKYGSEVTIVPDFEKLSTLEMQGMQSMPSVSDAFHEKLSQSSYLKAVRQSSVMFLMSDTMVSVGEADSQSDLNIQQNDDSHVMQLGPKASIQAYNALEYYDAFQNKDIVLVDGKMGEAAFDAVISESFARINHLELGDTFSSETMIEDEPYTFTVTGIYRNNGTQKNQTETMGLPGQDNVIYTPQTTVEAVRDVEASNHGYESFYTEYTYYLNNPDDFMAFQEEAQRIGLNENLKLTTDAYTYQQMVGPIAALSQSSIIYLMIVLGFGAIILLIVSILSIRDRKYEMGVLRSMGMKKGNVSLGILYESLIITAIACVLGIGIGTSMSQPVVNRMIQNQSTFESVVGSTNVNLSAAAIEINSSVDEEKQDDAVLNIDTALSTTSLVTIGTISIGIVGVSAIVGIYCAMRYEPMTALSERG